MTQQRRIPQQARSRKNYQHILNTAAALFAEHGVDQVTTNHIAASAEVSIGLIYQFFPNKEAIIGGLIDMYMQAAANIYPAELDTTIPIETVIRQVMTNVLAFNQQHVGFQLVLIGLEGTSNQEAATKMQEAVVAGIERVLGAYYPHLQPDQRQRCALVSFGLVAGIMPLPLPSEVMLEEMVYAVSAYQTAFLQRLES